MAEDAATQTSSAEKAYAAASAAVPQKAQSTAPAAAKPAHAEAKKSEAPTAPKPAAPKEGKPAARKVKATKPAPAPRRPIKNPAPVAAMKPPAPSTKQPTITQLKDKIMATAKTTDFSKTVTDAVGEFQRRAKEAYDKGSELSAEATEFAKGNVEAMVESGKIFATGVQDLGKSYASDAKSAYETVTGDLKDFAAVKSPTELFQLQSKLLRRNFDTLVAYGSKNTDAMVKLANESFAPLSVRMSLAAEKVAKVA